MQLLLTRSFGDIQDVVHSLCRNVRYVYKHAKTIHLLHYNLKQTVVRWKSNCNEWHLALIMPKNRKIQCCVLIGWATGRLYIIAHQVAHQLLQALPFPRSPQSHCRRACVQATHVVCCSCCRLLLCLLLLATRLSLHPLSAFSPRRLCTNGMFLVSFQLLGFVIIPSKFGIFRKFRFN